MERNTCWEANSHSASQETPAWRFIDVSTTARNWSLSWTRCILFRTIHSNIILHLRLGLSRNLFPSDSPIKMLYIFLIFAMRATRPPLLFDHTNNVCW